MKKLIILLFIFCTGYAKSQERTNFELITTLNSGLYLFGDWQVNQNLSDAGFPKIPTYEIPLGFGEYIRYKKLVLFPALSGNQMYDINSGNKLSTTIFIFNMPVLYRVFHSSLFDFYFGPAYQYSSHIAELSSGQSNFDLNDISNTLSSEYTSLMLVQHSIGPSLFIRENVLDNGPLLLEAGYQFPLQKKAWENTYGQVTNSPIEKGNYFYLSLVLSILKF